jgi:hypothetical protein
MPNRLISVALECAVCAAPYHPRYVRAGVLSRYCSKRCAWKAREVQGVCKTCGRVFTSNLVRQYPDYCSLACIERSPCQLCGEIITGRAKFQGGERRFCSRRCANVVNRTLAGKKNYVVRGFASTIRRHGALVCETCGDHNPLHLDVHHQDGDHANNLDENLVTLCANCHAETHRDASVSRTWAIRIANYIARY